MSSLTEWLRCNHYQETDPGTVWTKDEGVVIDVDEGRDPHRVLTPNVIALREGGYRMYYYSGEPERRAEGVTGCIVSAFSTDGDTWTREDGRRVDAHAPDAESRTLCPDVLVLPEGGYRMYYQAHSAADRGVVLSSRSSDGLEWTREQGVRFGLPGAVYGSPRCVPLEDGRWRLYCHEYPDRMPQETVASGSGAGVGVRPAVGASAGAARPDQTTGTGIFTGNHVISAISGDGLNFEREPGVRIEQERPLEDYAVYAVEVLRLGDGTYRMYYAGWSSDPVEGRIFSAVSDDGLIWVKDEGICLDRGGPLQGQKVSEPCVTRLPDGRFRMFYEANDGRRSGASSAPPRRVEAPQPSPPGRTTLSGPRRRPGPMLRQPVEHSGLPRREPQSRRFVPSVSPGQRRWGRRENLQWPSDRRSGPKDCASTGCTARTSRTTGWVIRRTSR